MGGWPETGNRARQLFNTITSHKKLMVGCKSDLFQKSRARRTHCVPCSVVSNHNIDNVFDQVTEILQFQDINQQVALRTPRSSTTATPGSDPTPRKSHNVKKRKFFLGRRCTCSDEYLQSYELSESSVHLVTLLYQSQAQYP